MMDLAKAERVLLASQVGIQEHLRSGRSMRSVMRSGAQMAADDTLRFSRRVQVTDAWQNNQRRRTSNSTVVFRSRKSRFLTVLRSRLSPAVARTCEGRGNCVSVLVGGCPYSCSSLRQNRFFHRCKSSDENPVAG